MYRPSGVPLCWVSYVSEKKNHKAGGVQFLTDRRTEGSLSARLVCAIMPTPDLDMVAPTNWHSEREK